MDIIDCRDLVIDVAAWEVLLRGEPVDLTKTEFQLLVALASRPRRVLTNEDLTELLWGEGWYGDDGNIAVHISKLRSKLGESGIHQRHIRTVRGVGYRFEPEPDTVAGLAVTSGEDLRHLSATLLVDLDRRVQWVSRSIRDLLGWEPTDLLGVLPRDLLHPDDRDSALHAMEEVSAGEPRLMRGRLRTSSGDYRSLAMVVRPIATSEGLVMGFAAEWQSVDTALGPDELQPIHLDFHRETRRAVTLTFDREFILRDISPRVPICDWEPDEIIGRYFSPSGRSEETLRSVATVTLAQHAREFRGPINIRCKDGRLVPAESETSIVVDDEGNFISFRTVLFLPASSARQEGLGPVGL